MIWRRNESELGAVIYKGVSHEEYPINWGWEGNITESLKNIPYYAIPLFEPFDSIDEFKYVFIVNETKVINRQLKYAFDTTAQAIDFVSDFLPLSMDGKLEISQMIIGERNFVYTEHYHNLTIHFKINNPQP